MAEIQTTTATRLWLEKAQLLLTISLIIGSLVYIGRRSESDEAQGRMLSEIASDIKVMKERYADANMQIRVIGERVAMLEKRLERMEGK
jgi:uncharacterized secreted protein with C-terminal beta-propeller domain